MSLGDEPAFPIPPGTYETADGTRYELHGKPGMSTRTVLAGMAMQGLCLGCCAHYTKGPCNSAIVERACVLADALLAELEKTP